MYKRYVLVIIVTLLVVFGMMGHRRIGDVSIRDYSISSNGDEMTLYVSSQQHIRLIKVNKQTETKMYLDSYSSFWRFGARKSFKIKIGKSIKTIALYKDRDTYTTILYKDEDGLWKRV